MGLALEFDDVVCVEFVRLRYFEDIVFILLDLNDDEAK
jgi:hypothetical protein